MRGEQGFSILEVLVSVGIFSVFALAVAQTFVYQMKTNSGSEIRSQAVQAAQLVFDRMRTEDASAMPTTGSSAPETVTVDGRPFVVTVSYCKIAAYCTTTTIRHLRAEVSYLNKKRYEVDTVYAQLR